MNCRIDKLYDTNEPGIRNLADICDIYLNVYSKLKNNIIITNNALFAWHNTWVIQYDGVETDPSLNNVFDVDRNMFKDLQDILKNQNIFYNSVKSSRLPNGDPICFTINMPTGTGSIINQTRNIRAKYNLGIVSNLGSDISNSSVIITADLTKNLSTDSYLAKYYYQIGMFALESLEVDTYFSTSNCGTVSQLYNVVLGTNNQDGTSIIEKNNRLVEQLVFSINMVNDLKKMLTYFA